MIRCVMYDIRYDMIARAIVREHPDGPKRAPVGTCTVGFQKIVLYFCFQTLEL